MSLADLPEMALKVKSNEPFDQLEGVRLIRTLLGIAERPPITPVIDTGVVPRLVEFMQSGHSRELQFEALWAITNVAAGSSEQTKAVIDAGAISRAVSLLTSPHDDVREQSCWLLANVAGDSAARP